jgi:hypothetical protein
MVVLSAWLPLPGPALANPKETLDPRALLERVERRYRSAESYQAAGEAVTIILQPEDGTESEVTVRFCMRLARPDFYRIVWTQRQDFAQSTVGALWNAGGGPALYLEDRQAYSTLPSDEVAFSAAAGMSMGVAYLIPMLFFGIGDGPSFLQRLEAIEDHGPATLEERACRILSGTLPSGVRYRLWIAEDLPEIVQIENVLGGKTSNAVLPELTAEKRSAVLQRMGLPDTPENRTKVKELMARARAVMRRLRGSSRQTHRRIDMLEPLSQQVFVFDPPPEAVLTPSVLSPAQAE